MTTEDKVGASDRSGRKHAVVVIHGMGEQHPMSTLRGFVRSVWEKNPDVDSLNPDTDRDTQVWTKPDRTAGSFELQRITTRNAGDLDGDEVRLDFYEFYWAHHTVGTTWAQLKDWVMTLLFRWPSTVPGDVIHVWWLLWVVNILILLLAPILLLSGVIELTSRNLGIYLVVFIVIAIPLGFLVRYFGDVARYVRPAPENIKIRHEIREAGVKFLRKLSDSDRYERITLVGHSLGSIVAYDLLIHFWAERVAEMGMTNGRKGTRALKTIRGMEQTVKELNDIIYLHNRVAALDGYLDDPKAKLSQRLRTGLNARKERLEQRLRDQEGKGAKLVATFRRQQRELFSELSVFDPSWKISDFISIGSPLTHAEFLLAADEEKFRQRVRERSLSACPPVLEKDPKHRAPQNASKEERFTYQPEKGRSKPWLMHHAAVFAPVCWTNIYDDDSWIFSGDIFSGSLAPLFGPAIEDIQVTILRRSGWKRFFTHTSYWNWTTDESDRSPPPHVRTLQRVLFDDVFPDRSKPSS